MNVRSNAALLLIATLFFACSSCFLYHTKQAVYEQPYKDAIEDMTKGLTKEELEQHPEITLLPNDAGWFFAYVFHSRDLTENEMLILLKNTIKTANQLSEEDDDHDEFFAFDTTNHLVIVAVYGKELARVATADYLNGEVEVWTGYPGKDWYDKETWEGDPSVIFEYMEEGAVGIPRYEHGRVSEELEKHTGKQSDI